MTAAGAFAEVVLGSDIPVFVCDGGDGLVGVGPEISVSLLHKEPPGTFVLFDSCSLSDREGSNLVSPITDTVIKDPADVLDP
jgi:hypothetical protein